MFINKATCKNCGDTVESKYTYDWSCCTCFSETSHDVDDFLKKHYSLGTWRMMSGMCEYDVHQYDYAKAELDPKYQELLAKRRGFFLDGGPEELGSRYGGNVDDIEWDNGLNETIKQVQGTY